MAQANPTTKITEPIPPLVRVGRPPKDLKQITNGHTITSSSANHLTPGAKIADNSPKAKVLIPPTPADLPKGIWSEQSSKVLKERYLLKNDQGEIVETEDQMCWRVAWDVAYAESEYGGTYETIEKYARDYYRLMTSHEFVPNSPTLMNAGKNNGLQYSACYVIPVDDTIEGIFDGIKWQAIVHKSGGGTGFSFSRLRGSNSRVGSTKGVASGPVSFMKIYDAATEQIKQGGMRRGANMGILRVDHPDILEFIHCKESGGITNFNISVAATDAFMKAYFDGTPYDLIDPHSQKIVGQLDARTVMDEIADGAWKTGDPGMIFIDQINNSVANPVPRFGPVESTNPCGEQPLYPFDACNLGSIFLTYFVKEDHSKKVVDWEKLELVAKAAVRFLDSVIERNPFPLPQIKETVTSIRRIGLGVGGWADMLAQLGIPYDSNEAITLAEKVMQFINDKGHRASEELAVERGPFPAWSESIYKDGQPLRNSTVTTIAPTGSIGIIANSSTGIEPFFAMAFKHYVKTNALERSLNFVNPFFESKAHGQPWYTDEVKEKIAAEGTIAHIDEIPDSVKKVFVTAHDIAPQWHVKMQAAFQKFTDNAVSKTVNMPNGATRDDIKAAYVQAYNTGCRGITVYRDGSKSVQVLNLGTRDKKPSESAPEANHQPLTTNNQLTTNGHSLTNGHSNGHQPPSVVNSFEMAELRSRPEKLTGSTYRTNTPVGHAFITVNSTPDGQPFEVFIAVGHAGSEVAADAEAVGRLVSMALRIPSQLSPREIALQVVDQLRGIGGSNPVGFGINRVKSLADAVAKVLEDHLKESVQTPFAQPSIVSETVSNQPATSNQQLATNFQAALPLTTKKDLCPSCGAAAFVFEEGCAKCHACGYSKC